MKERNPKTCLLLLPHAILLLLISAGWGKLMAQNPLTDSLIAYYSFQGNANDESGNENNGNVYGATQTADRFGNGSSAYSFDGVDDYIELTASMNFQPVTFPVSVCAWIRGNTLNSVTGLIFKNDAEPDQYRGIFFEDQLQYGGVIAISYGDGGTTSSCCRRTKIGTIVTNDNQWHFVAGVIRGPTDMDIYVDCAYDPGFYSGSGDEIAYSSGNGAVSKHDVLAGTYYYGGELDDIRFYHRELTQQDLQLLYYYPQPYGVSPTSVNLGNDTVLCPVGSLLLEPEVDGTALSYLWSDGSSDSTLEVNAEGEYWVQISDGCGLVSDTIQVGKGYYDPVYIGNDTMICDDDSLVLDAGIAYDTYEWSNGAFTSSIIVNTAGTYWVTVTGQGCTSSDSIEVTITECTGIADYPQECPVVRYDPNRGAIVFEGSHSCNGSSWTLFCIDAIGRVIVHETMKMNSGVTEFYLPPDLPPSLYLIRAETDHYFISLPVIVSH